MFVVIKTGLFILMAGVEGCSFVRSFVRLLIHISVNIRRFFNDLPDI
jgi:hypothetical protein